MSNYGKFTHFSNKFISLIVIVFIHGFLFNIENLLKIVIIYHISIIEYCFSNRILFKLNNINLNLPYIIKYYLNLHNYFS